MPSYRRGNPMPHSGHEAIDVSDIEFSIRAAIRQFENLSARAAGKYRLCQALIESLQPGIAG